MEYEEVDFREVGSHLRNRVFFVPQAKVVVVLPLHGKSLSVQKLDIDSELKASGENYFFVESHPDSAVTPGEQYNVKLAVKSSVDGIKYVLKKSPKEMTIGESGTISWNVPTRMKREPIDVEVQMINASGKQIAYTFKLRPNNMPRPMPAPSFSGKGSVRKGSISKQPSGKGVAGKGITGKGSISKGAIGKEKGSASKSSGKERKSYSKNYSKKDSGKNENKK